MNTKFLLFIFFIATISLGGSCCRKDEPALPTLPPETQTGANTFGCLLDGQVWLPNGSFSIPRIDIEYYNGSIIIAGNKGSGNQVNLNVTHIYSDTLFIILLH